ncbi:DUF1491 family protein [Meridianimarinicoccus aquatilis]|uniref:DUF1491 family protein n=1 Tax=Meridianimarinicoccus aquatilis TaxID=2552766 RepID=A0A4R6B518_9RHOB|nr:DUF1491 family protein [Fluviibacterium aquatile]TDL90626.1 DUF1491 family protein [Fluviibacterium aquatile]
MRLAAGLWVQAYIRRLQLADIPAYVIAKGDATAGSVIVKVARLDGTAVAKSRSFDMETGARIWMVLADGPEQDVDASLTRQRSFDPDLWIIEIESRDGRDLLDEPGLSD